MLMPSPNMGLIKVITLCFGLLAGLYLVKFPHFTKKKKTIKMYFKILAVAENLLLRY